MSPVAPRSSSSTASSVVASGPARPTPTTVPSISSDGHRPAQRVHEDDLAGTAPLALADGCDLHGQGLEDPRPCDAGEDAFDRRRPVAAVDAENHVRGRGLTEAPRPVEQQGVADAARAGFGRGAPECARSGWSCARGRPRMDPRRRVGEAVGDGDGPIGSTSTTHARRPGSRWRAPAHAVAARSARVRRTSVADRPPRGDSGQTQGRRGRHHPVEVALESRGCARPRRAWSRTGPRRVRRVARGRRHGASVAREGADRQTRRRRASTGGGTWRDGSRAWRSW